jgi:hypothetical protein
MIHLDAGAHTVVVAMSTDGGQSFSWLANFALSAGTAGPGPSPADDQPNIATGPGGTVAPGSVWVQWQDIGVGNSGIAVAGAPVYGLGQVGAFGAPESPWNNSGMRFGSIAVGPNGQLLVAYQSDLQMMGWPYHATIYAALDADGLGPGGFPPNPTPIPVATWTNVMLRFPIPPSPNMPINAAAHLAWDRSGGPHNGRVYLAYTDRPSLFDNDTNIFVCYSDDNGATWSAGTEVNDNPAGNQFWPSIAVDQTTGNVAVVWYDPRDDVTNTMTRLYGTVSVDGGGTFLPNVAIASGLSKASWAEDYMRGTSTGGNTLRTLNDTTQNWATNWWGPYGPVPLTQVHIIAGTGADPNTFYTVVSNSATQIVIDRDWAVIPDSTSVYEFALRYQYAYGGYTDVAFQGGNFYPIWADNSNSTLNNPDGTSKAFDLYTAGVSVTSGFGPQQAARSVRMTTAVPASTAGFPSLLVPLLLPSTGVALPETARAATASGDTISSPLGAGLTQPGAPRSPKPDTSSLERLFTATRRDTTSASLDRPAEDQVWADGWLLG